MIEQKVPSCIPIYAFGLFFFLYSLVFPMYRITDIIIAVSLSGVIYFVLNSVIKPKLVYTPYKKTGVADADAVINKGMDYIDELLSIHEKISNTVIKEKIQSFISIGRKIFTFISTNPKNARQLNTFIDYYFPTIIKLLHDYVELTSQQIQVSNITETITKIENIMSTVEVAFNELLNNLYADKALDVRTDIDVLKNILSSEGFDKKNSLEDEDNENI